MSTETRNDPKPAAAARRASARAAQPPTATAPNGVAGTATVTDASATTATATATVSAPSRSAPSRAALGTAAQAAIGASSRAATAASTPLRTMPEPASPFRSADPPPQRAGQPSGGDAPAARSVPAVERAVALLDALAASHEPQSLAELSRALSLPKSSVHGLLGTLVAAGLARRNADGEFALGPKALQWADAYAEQSDVLRAFHAHASSVPALRAETIMLATLDGADVLYLACRQGSRPLAVNFRVGGRFPAAITSSGKAMLASFGDEQVRLRVGDLAAARLTRHSVGSLPTLLRQLAQFRQQGWALDDEETAEGMQCFGAAVFGAQRSEPVAAVAVSVIKAGLTARRRTELVAGIRRLAASLSAELGATIRPPVRDAAPRPPVRRASGR